MLVLAINAYVVSGLVVAFLAVSIVLILTVLIQRPTGGGLSGAFGSGAGSGQTAFGAKTGDVLTIVTIVVFGVWILGAVGLNFATRPPEAPVDPSISATGDPGTDAADQDTAGQAEDTGEQSTDVAGDEEAAGDGEATGDDEAAGDVGEPAGGDDG